MPLNKETKPKLHANALEKGMNPSIFSPTMGLKIQIEFYSLG